MLRRKLLKYLIYLNWILSLNGKYIHFNNTNISINDPHKNIISNNSYCLILLSYENNNNFYLKDYFDINC